ncbi:MAG: DNA polymerase III subunit delta [Buchnera aphidicola (Periphyllus lyropictus)]|uniref:DNA polymerase III subunit delta n=1 Tax=Buchnera aphidicola TaxID=9 RepID=UPI001ECAF421|nr:DNA polymerase III subunit delta [Buchnera aphidicola]NIH16536.1 DNA polymerase III subunit delta [Buchnera aphidicola (Periphyllus lyropictus)]USS94429.1 DNA polymerase III subunit delta [Buchnera aphidicola (Periphyllus lyropictus)]
MNYLNLKNILKNIQKKIKSCYIIYGKEYFLIQKYTEIILKKINKNGIKFKKNIEIIKNKNWEKFFYQCKKIDFFHKKKIIILNIKIKNITKKILLNFEKNKEIFKLNIIIIIIHNLYYKNIIKSNFIKILPKKKIIIPCFNFTKKECLYWIKKYLKKNSITNSAKKYLYKKYNSNILLLNQSLDILSLIFLKKKIKKKYIKKVILDDKTKNIFQWINYLFLGKNKKSLLTLHSLYIQKVSPLGLVRYLENQIVILIILKKTNIKFKELFLKKKKIWGYNKKIYIRASKKNTYNQFLKIIKSLNWIELSIEKIEEESIWIILKEISIIFN